MHMEDRSRKSTSRYRTRWIGQWDGRDQPFQRSLRGDYENQEQNDKWVKEMELYGNFFTFKNDMFIRADR